MMSTNKKKVLILTDSEDDHLATIVRHLQKESINYLAIDINQEYRQSLGLSAGRINGYLSQCKKTINFDDIGAVLVRRVPLPKTDQGAYQTYIHSEKSEAFLALFYALKDRLWLNPLDTMQIAENRLAHIAEANKCGIKTPKHTLITNVKRDAYRVAEKEALLIKTMGWKREITKGRGLYATKILADDITKNISNCPVMFQSQIKKEFDVRITLVNKIVFGAKISNKTDVGYVDWRKTQNEFNTTVIEIPKSLERKCQCLADKLKLKLCSIDFAVDRRGEYYFLEINAMTDWLWIERKTKMPITDTLAKYLKSELKSS